MNTAMTPMFCQVFRHCASLGSHRRSFRPDAGALFTDFLKAAPLQTAPIVNISAGIVNASALIAKLLSA